MSSSRAGVSTSSFIRSISVVPPATNRTSAPCCAVFACPATLMAAAAFSGRANSNECMELSTSLRCVFTDLLNCGHDVGVSAAAANIAAHHFLHRNVVWTAGFFEERNRRHDLAGRAVAALVPVAGEKCRLHGMHGFRRAQALDRRDLFSVVHQSQTQTRDNTPAVDMDGARAALPVIAPFLCSCQPNAFANAIQ